MLCLNIVNLLFENMTGRNFQESWLQQFPWIEPNADQSKVLFVYICKWASINKRIPTYCRISKVWVHDGYCNWKKALGKDGGFKTHENSECHRLANTTYSSSACPNVIDMVSEQHV